MGGEQKIRVALIGAGAEAINWWVPVIRSSPSFDLVAVWSRTAASSHRLNDVAAGGTLEVYFELKKLKSKPDKYHINNLERLLESPNVDAFVIALPPEVHADIAYRILKNGSKHVFSCSAPTLTPQRLMSLISTHNDACARRSNLRGSRNSNQRTQEATEKCIVKPIWYLSDVLRHETSLNKVQALLSDIGRTIGAQLMATIIPSTPSHSSTGKSQDGSIFLTCVSYVSLLRRLMGVITSVNCIKTTTGNDSPETLAGSVNFVSGATASIMLNSSRNAVRFSLAIWGDRGHILITWDGSKQAYSVQRYLHHYEHPTLHPPTGLSWTLQEWAETILNPSQDVNSPMQSLIDMTIASAMIDANGSCVKFKQSSHVLDCGTSNDGASMKSPSVVKA